MIFSFYDRMCEAVEAKDPGLKEVSEKMDAEINKFVFFLERSIMKMSYPDPAIGRVLFAYSFNLEKISDEVQRMWRIRYEEKTITINEKVKEIMEMSKQALELAFQIYYHATPELILKVIELKKDMRKKTAKLFNINPGTTKFVMHALRIAEDCSDLTHLSLMKSIPLNND
jgi:phosphate uptake regulator